MHRWILAGAALVYAVALGYASPGQACPFAEPTGRVVLSIDGKIGCTNAAERLDLDMAMLDALPQSRIETTTPWTEGQQTFDGVAMADLLAAAKADGREVVARALNDYVKSVPNEDMAEYGVLVATRQNGQPMSVRKKGPLWIIYPDRTPERIATSRMVWQLRHLTVQ